jgi:hypothetical protein
VVEVFQRVHGAAIDFYALDQPLGWEGYSGSRRLVRVDVSFGYALVLD